MVYIAPAGVEDLTRIRVLYAEAGFECVAVVPPGADLKHAVEIGMDHGINEAAKQLQLPKKDLRALVSAPIVKEDGSSIPAEEWASTHFIVVEMKSEKKANGLLGKFRKQHTFLETVLRDGMKGLTASTATESSTAPAIESSTAPATESSAPKTVEERFSLLEDVWKKQVDVLKEDLKTQVEALQKENTDQKEAFQKQVDVLKTQVEALEKKIHDLSGMELIMIRKMVEQCREKSKHILQERNVAIPIEWNMAINDPLCIQALREAGLTTGLQATRFGRNSKQQQGSTDAHEITESLEAYATVVCKMAGDRRERMMNVFEFAFGSRAEDVAFSEDMY